MNCFKKILFVLIFIATATFSQAAESDNETEMIQSAQDYARQLALLVRLEDACINDIDTQQEEHCDRSYGCIICYRCARGPIDHIHKHEYRDNQVMRPAFTYLENHYGKETAIGDAFIDTFIATADQTQGWSYEDLHTLYFLYQRNPGKAELFRQKIKDPNTFPSGFSNHYSSH